MLSPNLNRRTHLSVEALEGRLMLSTVSLDALGSTGDEVLVVNVGDAEVFRTNVDTTANVFTFEVDDSVAVSDLRINFVNDLFDPGVVDRNLTVNELRFNGERFDLGSASVFSTGTWRPEDGVQDGFGRGNILHSNGFFQVAASEQIHFNGNVWASSRPFSPNEIQFDSVHNELVISGASGDDLAISRQVTLLSPT